MAQNLRRLHDHRLTFIEREQVRAERMAVVRELLVQGMSYRRIVRVMNNGIQDYSVLALATRYHCAMRCNPSSIETDC